MYKSVARLLIRRTINRLNQGDYGMALALFARGAELTYPGDNSLARQHRPPRLGRERFATHRGRDEIEAFLQRYVELRIQMVVEDILVNGPPWNTRSAVRVRYWIPGDDGGSDPYNNRAVLFAELAWGKIRRQEDYTDTQRVTEFELATADGASPADTPS
jgi:ketosteroid isomerase-like protein